MTPAAVLSILVKTDGVGKAQAELSGLDKSARRTSAGFDDAGSSAAAAGSKLKTFGKVAALGMGAAVVGLAAVGKATVGVASDINESLSKNEKLFGKSAATVDKFSKSSAKSFGISRRSALEYTGVFGNLQRALGISQKAAAENSVSLTKLAADMASFNNTSVEEALNAIRSGLTGETEPLKRFGVVINEAAIQAQALSTGLVKASVDSEKVKAAAIRASVAQDKYTAAAAKYGKESVQARTAQAGLISAQKTLTKAQEGGTVKLTAQQKALASQALIVRQTKNAHGDFADTSAGLAAQQKILAARFEDAKAKLGSLLLPAALAMVGAFNKLFTSVESGSGVFGALKDVLVTTYNVVTTLLPAIVALGAAFVAYKAVTLATSAIQTLSLALGVLRTVYVAQTGVTNASTLAILRHAAAARISAAAMRVAAVATAAWNAVLLLNPIGLVIAAMIALGAGLVVLYKKWEPFRKVVNSAFGALKDGWQWVKGNWPLLLAILTGPFGLAVLAIVKYGDRIVDFMKSLPGKAGAALKGAAGAVVGAARSVGAKIVDGIIGGFGGWLGKLKSKIEEGLKSTLEKLNPFSPVSHGGEKYIGRPLAEGAIRGWVLGSAPLSQKLSERVREAVDAARQKVNDARGPFADAFGGLAQSALSAFDAIAGKMVTPSEKILNNTRENIRRRDAIERLNEARTGLAAAKVPLEQGHDEGLGDFVKRLQEQKEAVKTGQRAVDDALWQVKEIGLERRAAQERLELDASNALRRTHLEQRLTMLQAALAKEGTTQESAHKKVMKLLKTYGVDYAEMGRTLGWSFVLGLQESLGKALGKAEGLKTTIGDILSGKLKSTEKPKSGGSKSGGNDGTTGGLKDWLTTALKATGQYSAANLAALTRRAMQESGGNPKAINLWDSNAKKGTPSKGVLQTIEPTFNAYKMKGHSDIWNPVDNAIAAIRYMMDRYGHIVDANGKGYAKGGVTPGGWALVGEEGPELTRLAGGTRVFPAAQTQKMLGGGGAEAAGNTFTTFANRLWAAQTDLMDSLGPMPRIVFGKLKKGVYAHAAFGGGTVAVSPEMLRAYRDATNPDHDSALQALVHEFAHSRQSKLTAFGDASMRINDVIRQVEGGADVFSHMMAPRLMQRLGVDYDAARTKFAYPEHSEWVLRNKSAKWWKHDQFARSGAGQKVMGYFPNGVAAFAEGGIARGGMALVGERGPELVDLPAGARVYSNAQSQGMGGGGSTTVVEHHYHGPVVQDEAFVSYIKDQLRRDERRNGRPAFGG